MSKIEENIQKISKEGIAKRKIEVKISVADSINALLCFIMPQCVLFSNMIPFGFSAYAAFFTSDRWFIYLGAAFLGILRTGGMINILPYLFAMMAATAIMGFFDFSKKIHIRSVCAGGCLFFALLAENIFSGFYLYEAFLNLTEALLCATGVYMFDMALPVMLNGDERRYISDVEMVSVIGLFALIIRCLSDLPLIFGLNPAIIGAILLLLIINLEGELSTGAAMGVILGIVSGGDAEGICAATGAFSFASMCSGMLKRFGRWGVVLGFTFANAFMTVFFSGETLPFDIFEVITASVIFALIPQRITAYISSFPAKTVHTSADTNISHDKLQKVICSKLQKLSNSFSSLAGSYERCFENTAMSKEYIIQMLDTASSKICPDCGLKYSCWERGYKESYKAMLKMLETAEKKGRLSPTDIPETFSSKCTKSEAFTDAFNRMFEIYKVEKIWQERLNESRQLVSGQLRGIAGTISNLSSEFDMCLDIPAEKQLKTMLDRAGVRCDDITFMCGKGGSFAIDITFKSGQCSKKDEQRIINVVSEITEEKIYLASTQYIEKSLIMTFKPRYTFSISTGSASVGKGGEDISGDSYIISENVHGETVIAISDGMGSGVGASKESMAATELLESFLSAGMRVETSLELINSSLLLRSSGDNFATMDVCTIRPSDGIINFSKSGAAPSYIKNEYGITKIESSSLPFGILNEESEVKTEIYSLENSAIILMVSDGVCDVFENEDEDGILKKLEETETVNPQIIASLILNTAIELSGGKPDDDMTVIAVSMWKN